jgi:GNAT superfamily N-acetyltransferase
VLAEDELEYGVFSGDRETLSRTVLTVVYEARTGRPVAFNALALLDAHLGGRPVEILHLGLVMVRPDVRGKGLSATLYGLTCVLLFLRRQCRPLWISSVTQVPAVVGMVAETFSGVFPGRPGSHQSFQHRRLAIQIMDHWRRAFGVGADAGFDEARFVITNAYTGGSDELKKTLDQTAKHRDERYNALCAGELDYTRGDDLLQIGQIDMRAAARYLARVAPPDSLPGMVAAFALLMIQTALLPLLHWLDASQPWGSLRAWKA